MSQIDKFLFVTDDGRVRVAEGIDGLCAKVAYFFQQRWFEQDDSKLTDEEINGTIENILQYVNSYILAEQRTVNYSPSMRLVSVSLVDLDVLDNSVKLTIMVVSQARGSDGRNLSKVYTMEVVRR